jgi:hypothetical protein
MSPNEVTIREVVHYLVHCGRCQRFTQPPDRSAAEHWATFHDCRPQHVIDDEDPNYDEMGQ